MSAPLRTSSSRRSRTRDHYGTTPHGQYQSWNPDSIILEIFTCGISYYSKGRYTRGVLLLEHAPGSFCTCQYTQGSVFKFAQFAPGACSQIFNRLNIVEHFAGWKFCSRRWSIPMKSLVHTEELCSRSVPLEHAVDFPRLLWAWGPATFIENKRKMEPDELSNRTIFSY